MAKIKVVGDAIVITSALKLEAIKRMEKYNPGSLEVKGGENGKEVVFKVGTTTGQGGVSKYGISFASATHDEEALACITMAVPAGLKTMEAIKEYIADDFAAALGYLATIEASAPAELEAIAASRQAVMDSVEVG